MVGGRFEYLSHVLKRLSYVVVYSLESHCNVFVEVVEIGDELGEAQIDESVTTDYNAGVYLFLGSSRKKPVGKITHDIVYVFVEIVGQLLVDEVL